LLPLPRCHLPFERLDIWQSASVRVRYCWPIQQGARSAQLNQGRQVEAKGVLVIDEHGDRKWGKHTAHVGREWLAKASARPKTQW
jgi:SRSO17 transposase